MKTAFTFRLWTSSSSTEQHLRSVCCAYWGEGRRGDCRTPNLIQAASILFSVLLGDCLPAQRSTPEHRSWPLYAALAKEAPTKADRATPLPGSRRSWDSQDVLHLPHIIRKRTKVVLLNAGEEIWARVEQAANSTSCVTRRLHCS